MVEHRIDVGTAHPVQLQAHALSGVLHLPTVRVSMLDPEATDGIHLLEGEDEAVKGLGGTAYLCTDPPFTGRYVGKRGGALDPHIYCVAV